jgi:transcriptional regulator with XRE-family HTH domain
MTIPEQIKQIRILLCLSQRDLAKKMAIPQSTMVRIESGDYNISQKTIEKFCEATGATVFLSLAKPSEHLIQQEYNKIYIAHKTLQEKLKELLV